MRTAAAHANWRQRGAGPGFIVGTSTPVVRNKKAAVRQMLSFGHQLVPSRKCRDSWWNLELERGNLRHARLLRIGNFRLHLPSWPNTMGHLYSEGYI